MKRFLRGVVAAVAAAAAATAGYAQSSRQTDAIDPAGIRQLMAETGGRARVSLHPATGAVRFLRVDPGEATLAPSAPRTARRWGMPGCAATVRAFAARTGWRG